MTVHVSLENSPALVLNADFRPLSYYPLSLWSWQDAIKAIFLDRVHVVSNYDRVIKSPSFEMLLPSVVSLKDYVRPARHPIGLASTLLAPLRAPEPALSWSAPGD